MAIYSFKSCKNFCGGKAYGLNLLSENNVPVPTGIVVSEFDINNTDDIKKIDKFISSFDANQLFAIRSSANIEDGENESFAGIFDTVLNVKNNIDDILLSIKKVVDSVKSDTVKAYTTEKDIKMNVIIQKMITPKLSGVCFANAIDYDGKPVALIEIVNGLGEQLVSGTKNSYKMIIPYINKTLNTSEIRYSGNLIDISTFSNLFIYVQKLIDKYNNNLDLEWCIDEENNTYLLQMRPVTKKVFINKTFGIKNETGIIVTRGFAKGNAYLIDSNLPYDEVIKKISDFKDGDILISNTTETYYLPAMKKASGIITESGSVLCHAAIVAREYNIPCIVAYENIMNKIKNGDEIVLDTLNNVIKVNNNEIVVNNKYNFNYFDLDCFENYFSYIINDKTFYIESTFKGIVVHSFEKPNENELSELEIFIREHFDTNPYFSMDNNKYLWIQEIERFKKLPNFLNYYNQVMESAKNLNSQSLEDIKSKCMQILKNFVKYKQTSNNLILNSFIDEYCAAINELLVGIIPFGAPLKESYIQSIQYLKSENLNFNDLLNKKIFVKNTKLKKIKQYLEIIEKIKNDTYQEIWDMNAMDPDYFEKRDEKIQIILENENIKSENNIMDNFYTKFLPKVYNDLKNIIEK